MKKLRCYEILFLVNSEELCHVFEMDIFLILVFCSQPAMHNYNLPVLGTTVLVTPGTRYLTDIIFFILPLKGIAFRGLATLSLVLYLCAECIFCFCPWCLWALARVSSLYRNPTHLIHGTNKLIIRRLLRSTTMPMSVQA